MPPIRNWNTLLSAIPGIFEMLKMAADNNAGALSAYLEEANEQEFFVSSYIDYRSADGLYRKADFPLQRCHAAEIALNTG